MGWQQQRKGHNHLSRHQSHVRKRIPHPRTHLCLVGLFRHIENGFVFEFGRQGDFGGTGDILFCRTGHILLGRTKLFRRFFEFGRSNLFGRFFKLGRAGFGLIGVVIGRAKLFRRLIVVRAHSFAGTLNFGL